MGTDCDMHVTCRTTDRENHSTSAQLRDWKHEKRGKKEVKERRRAALAREHERAKATQEKQILRTLHLQVQGKVREKSCATTRAATTFNRQREGTSVTPRLGNVLARCSSEGPAPIMGR